VAGADPRELDVIAQSVTALVDKSVSYWTSDPEVSLAQARKAAETIARAIYARELGEPSKIGLNELLHTLAAHQLIPRRIQIPLGTIQIYGNYGAHAQSDARAIDAVYAAPALAALSAVVTWFFEEYLQRPAPPEFSTYTVPQIARPAGPPARRSRRRMR
jgi:hypothetical protein